jgi:hypothetical protein
MIPDKLLIGCRRVISSMDCTYSDNYATITNVNINFNNYNGLLSNATPQQLWKMSRESGLANLTWEEFSGAVVSGGSGDGSGNLLVGQQLRTPYEGVGAYTYTGTSTNFNTPGIALTPTTGSLLCLEFGKDIQLTEDYLAPGSLGQFHLLVTLSVYNNEPYQWPANGWELFIIPLNSGIYAIERGVANLYTGLLTKADVLAASEGQEAYTRGTIKRMV